MNNLISVIVPVFNAKDTIDRCLKSLINQTYKNLEIILVDDNSQDNSVEIIKSYNDDRIKLICQTKNGGVSISRNMGLELSTGDYVSFVDCDDYISLDFYEDLLQVAVKTNSDIVMTRTIIVDNGVEKERKISSNKETVKNFKEKLDKNRLGVCWDKLYKANMLKDNNVGFKEGIMWEDTLFSAQALYYCNSLSFCENAKYYYIRNSNSLTKSNQYKIKRDKDKLLILKESMLFIKNCIKEQKDQKIAARYFFKIYIDIKRVLEKEYINELFLVLDDSIIKKYSLKRFILRLKIKLLLKKMKSILLVKGSK